MYALVMCDGVMFYEVVSLIVGLWGPVDIKLVLVDLVVDVIELHVNGS